MEISQHLLRKETRASILSIALVIILEIKRRFGDIGRELFAGAFYEAK